MTNTELNFADINTPLKKLAITMGVRHQETSVPWDKPSPEVFEYCKNDVMNCYLFMQRLYQMKARQNNETDS